MAVNIYPLEEKKNKDDGKVKKKHKEGHTKEKKDRKDKDGKSKKPKKDRKAFGHEVEEATECEATMDAVDRKAEGKKSKKSKKKKDRRPHGQESDGEAAEACCGAEVDESRHEGTERVDDGMQGAELTQKQKKQADAKEDILHLQHICTT